MILNFANRMYSDEKQRIVKEKHYYLTIGKDIDNGQLHLPCNQYGTTPSPGDNKTKKIHILETLPPAIRLSRDEREIAEKLKVLVFQYMPRLVRRNQMN